MSDSKRCGRRHRRFRAPFDDDMPLSDSDFHAGGGSAAGDRKTLQLCRQALRSLGLALRECGDPVLQNCRHDAARTVSERELCRQMRGVWFDARRARNLRDEAPSAYKDITAVMRARATLSKSPAASADPVV